MGASGSGKDSLIGYLRQQRLLQENHSVSKLVFAHRYITRAFEKSGENHVALTEAEYKLRLAHGCFTLHWSSHNLFYGVGVEIDVWLNQGLHVVVNGSRAYFNKALLAYPQMIPILICAESEIIRARLQARGRESREQIDARVQRGEALNRNLSAVQLTIIHNNGELCDAGQQLLRVIEESIVSIPWN